MPSFHSKRGVIPPRGPWRIPYLWSDHLSLQVAWLVVRFLLRRSTVTWTSYAALGLTSLVYAICYPGIATALGEALVVGMPFSGWTRCTENLSSYYMVG